MLTGRAPSAFLPGLCSAENEIAVPRVSRLLGVRQKAFARRSRAGDRVPMESAESDVVSKLPATRVSRDRSSARPADLCGPPRAASGSMSALPRRESVSADGAALRCAVPMSGLSPPVCGIAVARHATPRGQAGSADRDDARLLQPLISQAASALAQDNLEVLSRRCQSGGPGSSKLSFRGAVAVATDSIGADS